MNVLLHEKVSDHSTIIIDMNEPLQFNLNPRHKTSLIRYTGEKLRDNWRQVNWSVCTDMNANEKANFFVNNLKECVSEFIKTVSIDSKDKPWYNRQLHHLRKQKQQSYQRQWRQIW